jgi:hypothetical protein
MRKITLIVIAFMSIFSLFDVQAQTRKGMVDSLTTIDPEIRKYFPRWKVCETDLQIQIFQAFRLLGFSDKLLNKSKIEILAAPRNDEYVPFDILLIKCGDGTMNSAEIAGNFTQNLYNIIAGEAFFARAKNPPQTDLRARDYCYVEIPPEIPVSSTEAEAIINYLRPSNVDHSFSVSLFDQSLKFGSSGFWLSNIMGNDEVGYPFWNGGESKIILQRPLYANTDAKTVKAIPYLLDMYIGGAYKINAGIDPKGTLLSWVAPRKLNNGPGGKIVTGLDFNMPFHPQLGLHLNAEIPLQSLRQIGIDEPSFAYTQADETVDFYEDDYRYGTYKINKIAHELRGTGQIAAYYYWWPGEASGNFENFLRFDLGISYCEVRQLGVYRDTSENITYMTPHGVSGLQTFKPNEFADWVYAKLEYRNSAFWPFGISAQLSNQMLLGRIYVPLVNWLYIEAKVATTLRPKRPYESGTFFMVSPVIRLTI